MEPEGGVGAISSLFSLLRALVPHRVRNGLFLALNRVAFCHLATPPAYPQDAPEAPRKAMLGVGLATASPSCFES